MNSHPNHQTDDAAANAILIAVVVGLSIVAIHWAAATVATGLRHGRFLGATSKATVESIKTFPKHWRDPAAAWPEPFRSSLPGPVLYWASAVLVVAVLVALSLLVLRFRHPPLEAPDRRRRLGVDVQPRLAKQVELKSLLERTPAPNRLVLARWNRRDLLLTEPSMIGRRRGVRGAVAVFGPSQSGKTTGLIVGVNEWIGPAVVSSVKTDLLTRTITARRACGEVKVFDPMGISGIASVTWTPLRAARTLRGALAAAHLLAGSSGDEGTTDKFWRGQSEQLLAGMLWIAANTEGHTMRHVVDWVTTLDRPTGDSNGTLAPLARLLIDHDDPVTAAEARKVRGMLTGQWTADPKTSASIYTTARNAIWPWTDPGVEASAASCEITLDWLLSGNNTLYLVAPLGDEHRVGRVFSVMMQDLISQAFEQANRMGKSIDPGLLVVLDEAANTPLPTLPEWAATVTGAGVQLVTVWQSKGQIDRQYGKDADNLLTNHRTKMLYPSGLSDLATIDYFEKLVGNEHVRSDLDDPGGRPGSFDSRSMRASSTAVPFLTPAVLRQMNVGDAVLIHGALRPIWIRARG